MKGYFFPQMEKNDRNLKMAEITEITKIRHSLPKILIPMIFMFLDVFFQLEEEKKSVKIGLMRGREKNLCVLPEKYKPYPFVLTTFKIHQPLKNLCVLPEQ